MTQVNKNTIKTDTYLDISAAEAQGLKALKASYVESRRHTLKIRKGADAANDSLYEELEARYGGGFAQWVTDRLNAVISKEKAE